MAEQNDQTAFLTACEVGDHETALAIMARCPTLDLHATTTEGGKPAFWLAVAAGCKPIAKEMIRRNVDVNQTDESGHTPLVMATMIFATEIAQWLLRLPQLDVNTSDNGGLPQLFGEPYDYVLYSGAFLLNQAGVLPKLCPPATLTTCKPTRTELMYKLLRMRYVSKGTVHRKITSSRRKWKRVRARRQ
jgi:hypothetical protein